MKAGEKYIIEIETVVNGLAKIKGFNTLVFDEFGLDKLEKMPSNVALITPVDLEQIKVNERREGYTQGFNDGVQHQKSMMLVEEEEEELREPQIGDVYRKKTDGTNIIITYDDMGTYTALLSDGDNTYYNTEELNKYFEFIENRGDVLEALKGVLI